MRLLAIHRLVPFVYYLLLQFTLSLPIVAAFTMNNSNNNRSNEQPLVIVDTDLDQLVTRCHELLQEKKHSPQVWVGLAGPPGSGKSTLASKLSQKLGPIATVLPMDGYHIPKVKLSQTDFERRGAPWTFDSSQFVEDLQKAKQQQSGSFPIYDRSIGDPVPNRTTVEPSHKIVFVEGLYVFAFDHEDWAPLQHILDDMWYIHIPDANLLKERLVERHLRNWSDKKAALFGSGQDGARRKVEQNDGPNADFVQKNSQHHAKVWIVHDEERTERKIDGSLE